SSAGVVRGRRTGGGRGAARTTTPRHGRRGRYRQGRTVDRRGVRVGGRVRVGPFWAEPSLGRSAGAVVAFVATLQNAARRIAAGYAESLTSPERRRNLGATTE